VDEGRRRERDAKQKPGSSCLGPALQFGHFQSVAQGGLKSIAQGLPWVSKNKRSALKGLDVHSIRLEVWVRF
jgi:hypothetical protein